MDTVGQTHALKCSVELTKHAAVLPLHQQRCVQFLHEKSIRNIMTFISPKRMRQYATQECSHKHINTLMQQ